MRSIKQIIPLFIVLIAAGKLHSQGTTTLTINSPTPVAVYTARDLVTVKPGASGAKLIAGASTITQLVIDKNVVAPIDVNGNPYGLFPGWNYNFGSIYTIDKHLPVGFVNGSGGVSNGQSNYNIPIYNIFYDDI